MSRYTKMLGGVSPSTSAGKRAADIVAALAPPPRDGAPDALARLEREQQPALNASAMSLLPWVGGGAVGAYLWKDHRVLGFLAGGALASTVGPIYKGGPERRRALARLGIDAAGILGSLKFQKHPILGWIGGVLAGSIVASLVPGTFTYEQRTKWRSAA
jgi:hypothetical protein